MPEGVWFDYWDGRRIVGPTTIDNCPVTLDKLPVFVKGGAIIPMYPEMLYIDQKPKDPLTLDIYPYGKSEFELYEDDGRTRKYQAGEFATQKISVDAPKNKADDIEINNRTARGPELSNSPQNAGNDSQFQFPFLPETAGKKIIHLVDNLSLFT